MSFEQFPSDTSPDGSDEDNTDRDTADQRFVADDDSALLRHGVRCYRRALYAEALPILLRFGNDGNLEARRLLSRIFYAGQGVPADPERYLYWLARAAESGDPAARAKLKRRQAAGEIPDSLADDPFIRSMRKNR